jgi:hypothetical protein
MQRMASLSECRRPAAGGAAPAGQAAAPSTVVVVRRVRGPSQCVATLARMDSAIREELLERVAGRYLSSSDFNGFYVGAGSDVGPGAEALLRDGQIEVIAPDDFPNPHIRPWASRKSVSDQLAAVAAAIDGSGPGLCLYPTAAVLAGHPRTSGVADRPYTERLAKGAGQLEVAYFRMDVLEAYRNDPRFSFEFDDFGAHVAVADEVYEDESEPAADKVSMRLGFAYELPLNDGPIVPTVCAFLRDLKSLSPAHKRRWQTFEITETAAKPHPIWIAEAMGHWIDRIGAFDAFTFELTALNELHERAFGTSLLRTTERPPELGWILRPSQLEFDQFVQLLDKLLSENIRHDALDAAGIPRTDEDGQTLGTLKRLDLMLVKARVNEQRRRDVLKPLREVRSARQKPAHALRQNISNANFVRRQAELLQTVTNSLHALRTFWQEHPANRDWTEPDHIKTAKRLWL